MSLHEFLERIENDPFDPDLVEMFLTAEEDKSHEERTV